MTRDVLDDSAHSAVDIESGSNLRDMIVQKMGCKCVCVCVCACVCVRERERVRVNESVCVRESACMRVDERESAIGMCVRVCVYCVALHAAAAKDG